MKYSPKRREHPQVRQPVSVVDPASYDACPIRVRFDLLDFDHSDWGWTRVSQAEHLEFLRFVQSIEKMTWAELKVSSKGGSTSKGTKHHAIEIIKFRDRAQERLDELNLQRVLGDKLFSMRLDGTTRVYGGRDKEYFRPIWHDPFHEYGNEQSAYPLDEK